MVGMLLVNVLNAQLFELGAQAVKIHAQFARA
jgi:hypothetical protein